VKRERKLIAEKGHSFMGWGWICAGAEILSRARRWCRWQKADGNVTRFTFNRFQFWQAIHCEGWVTFLFPPVTAPPLLAGLFFMRFDRKKLPTPVPADLA